MEQWEYNAAEDLQEIRDIEAKIQRLQHQIECLDKNDLKRKKLWDKIFELEDQIENYS